MLLFTGSGSYSVLNLVINGIPSIPYSKLETNYILISFKPCYKWNTFNTITLDKGDLAICLF